MNSTMTVSLLLLTLASSRALSAAVTGRFGAWSGNGQQAETAFGGLTPCTEPAHPNAAAMKRITPGDLGGST